MTSVDRKEYFSQSVLKSALPVALNECPHSVDIFVGEAKRATIHKPCLEAPQNALKSATPSDGPAQHFFHLRADRHHYLLVALR